MTTTDAVAARHHVRIRERADRWTLDASPWGALRGVLGAVLLAAALAGCGSTGLLGPSDTPTQATGPAVLPIQQAQAPASRARIAIAPVMGAPEDVSKQVGTQLGSELEKQRVSVAQSADRPDYTLRGYMVATPDKGRTKVAYIFDLTDSAGKRVNRIQGEEIAQGVDARNNWSVVSPEVSKRITEKAATSLATALTSLGPTGGAASSASAAGTGGSVAGSPASGGAVSAAPPAAIAAATPPPLASEPSTAAAPPAAGATTRVSAIVPAVTGAPGDGNDSLSNAMRQELQQAGIGAGAAGQRGAYSVAGRVTMGAVKDGKQSIKIDWRVTDPAGTLLATVTQNNEIQAGSLDGPWGNIASDAAQGAAQRIRQLIDENQASAGSAPRTKSAQRGRG